MNKKVPHGVRIVESAIETMIERVSKHPLDPDRFIKLVQIYQAAAAGTDPASHLVQTRKLRRGEIQLADIPMNRGVMAVMRATTDLSSEERQAAGLRLLYLGQALSYVIHDPRFAEHARIIDADQWDVSHEFHRAFARCRFIPFDGEMGPDLDHLLSLLTGGSLS